MCFKQFSAKHLTGFWIVLLFFLLFSAIYEQWNTNTTTTVVPSTISSPFTFTDTDNNNPVTNNGNPIQIDSSSSDSLNNYQNSQNTQNSQNRQNSPRNNIPNTNIIRHHSPNINQHGLGLDMTQNYLIDNSPEFLIYQYIAGNTKDIGKWYGRYGDHINSIQRYCIEWNYTYILEYIDKDTLTETLLKYRRKPDDPKRSIHFWPQKVFKIWLAERALLKYNPNWMLVLDVDMAIPPNTIKNRPLESLINIAKTKYGMNSDDIYFIGQDTGFSVNGGFWMFHNKRESFRTIYTQTINYQKKNKNKNRLENNNNKNNQQTGLDLKSNEKKDKKNIKISRLLLLQDNIDDSDSGINDDKILNTPNFQSAKARIKKRIYYDPRMWTEEKRGVFKTVFDKDDDGVEYGVESEFTKSIDINDEQIVTGPSLNPQLQLMFDIMKSYFFQPFNNHDGALVMVSDQVVMMEVLYIIGCKYKNIKYKTCFNEQHYNGCWGRNMTSRLHLPANKRQYHGVCLFGYDDKQTRLNMHDNGFHYNDGDFLYHGKDRPKFLNDDIYKQY